MKKIERVIREFEEDKTRAELAIRILMDDDFYQRMRRFDQNPVVVAREIYFRQRISDKCCPIEDLELPAGTLGALKRVGIDAIGELCQISKRDLMRLPRIGKVSVALIEQALGRCLLRLK